MIDPPELVEVPAQRTAVIHLVIPRHAIQSAMGPAIGEVMGTLAAQGVAPAGPVFTCHHRLDPEVFDFEVGAPVAGAFTPSGRVVAGELPAATLATTVYRGPYEGLHAAWEAFDEWIVASGRIPGMPVREAYLVGPESGPDASRWQTRLSRPVEPR